MANPIFSKSGVTSVTLTQAEDLESTTPKKPRQRIGRSDSGRFYVAVLSEPDQEFNLAFSELPEADHDALLAFLEDPLVNWSQYPFVYTDSAGTERQVRFLDGNFPAPEIAPGVYDVRFTLALDSGPMEP